MSQRYKTRRRRNTGSRSQSYENDIYRTIIYKGRNTRCSKDDVYDLTVHHVVVFSWIRIWRQKLQLYHSHLFCPELFLKHIIPEKPYFNSLHIFICNNVFENVYTQRKGSWVLIVSKNWSEEQKRFIINKSRSLSDPVHSRLMTVSDLGRGTEKESTVYL